jgi:hypothetical protein
MLSRRPTRSTAASPEIIWDLHEWFDASNIPRLWGHVGEDLARDASVMTGSPIKIVVPMKRPGGKGDHGSQADEA